MTEIFKFKAHSYDLRENSSRERRIIISCKYVREKYWNLVVKLSDVLQENFKKSHQDFKDKGRVEGCKKGDHTARLSLC